MSLDSQVVFFEQVDNCAQIDDHAWSMIVLASDRARVDDPSTRAGKEAAVAADALDKQN